MRELPWRPALTAWGAARVVVLLALAASVLLRDVAAERGLTRSDDLLGWDASWYRRIADVGYDDLPPESIRFFPLLPLLARALAVPLGGHDGIALLLLANAAALGYGLLLWRLCRLERLGEAAAQRCLWVAAFAPAAFVLVMGYTEALFGCLLAGCFLAARTGRWWYVAVLGVLAGAMRPTGVVVAVPVLIEAARGLSRCPWRELVARAAAVAAPMAGLASYLAWVWVRFGDPLLPFRVQVEPRLRGGTFVNPFGTVLDILSRLPQREALGSLLHVAWAGVALALLVVVARRLPASYTAFASVTLVLALTARDLTSLERYASSALPLLLAAAVTLDSPRRARLALAVGSLALFSYALAAFLHAYVP